MLWFAIVLSGVVVVVNVLLIFGIKFNFKQFDTKLKGCPPVAILLAVRNEAHFLPSCLDHLLAVEYPRGKLQIWIGNDMSEDDTLSIAQRYARQDDRIRVVDVAGTLGEARAKANIIAHLVQASAQATPPADILLVTDADGQATPGWVKGMLRHWQAEPPHPVTGIVTGVTVVEGHRAWDVGQRIDWLFALGMVKVASDLGVPVATLGNNMLLYRPAYEATGGYETMPFSITEDFQILHRTVERGYGFRNIIDPDALVMTQPMTDLAQLLQQRKRWTHGALQLPVYLVAILLLQAFFYPILLVVAVQQPLLAIGLWVSKVLTQAGFIFMVVRKVNLPTPLRKQTLTYLIPFELYSALLSLISLLYYLTPIRIVWKGRQFGRK